MFAGAPGYHFGLGNLNFFGLQAGPLVRTITEGLTLGSATSAPPIRAGLHFLNDRRFLRNNGIVHKTKARAFDARADLLLSEKAA